MTQSRAVVYYSAVIPTTRIRKVCFRSFLFRLFGFRQCKIKVGVSGHSDVQAVRWTRNIFGNGAALRVDANEAWRGGEVIRQLSPLERFRIESVEQPVPHEQVQQLREVRRQLTIPVMLDESLCCLEDAERAIQEELCDAFNLRLSKCGGIVPTLQLARHARSAGLTVQLGCHVGETGILSAAGRHFATSIQGLTALEGSFDRFLVREPLTKEDLTFGMQGGAPAIQGPGLGVTIDEAAVHRVTVASAVMKR